MIKKIAIVTAFIMFCACTNALAFNWYAGTSLKLTSLSGDESGTVFAVAPEVGYIFSDKIDAGVGFAYATDDTGAEKTTEYLVVPFVRYKVYTKNNFSFFARAQVSGGSIDDGIERSDVFGAALMPVVEYAVSDRFTLFTSFAAVSYEKVSSKTESFSLDVDMNDLTVGFSVNF
ncbi:hypothetical protein Dip510_001079 [Elusimicrobium posterum]|uniref:hypothetical protein n=1 Tax=Elusimicrobium posterum TaxID=3116653 RepID=UPI003C74DFDB